MTVSSQTNNATFVGNGATTVFPLPFRFFNNSEIFAYFIDPNTGASTPMVLGTDFTLAGAGEPEVDGNAVSVLTTTVPLASLRSMYVERIIPDQQETDIVNQGEFFATTHEDVFDRLTMLIQQAGAASGSAIRVAIGDPSPARLPSAQARNTTLMGFDENGDPIVIPYRAGDAAGLAALLASQANGTEGTRLIGHSNQSLYAKLDEMPSFRDYGAKLDGVTDDTAAINACLADNAGKIVRFPSGTALVKNAITVPADTAIIGDGVIASQFLIPSDFNLAATGVLVLSAGGQSSVLESFGFNFTQPDSPVRANMVQYPYAINHAGVARVRIHNIRIRSAWNGINASGNAGGSSYGLIECGAFNIGLFIDGSLDTFNIGHFKAWPFGAAANNTATVYYDGTTRAAVIGRCDGMTGEIHAFRSEIHFTTGAGSSAARGLQAIHLDGDGARLLYESGMLDIDYLYCTKSAAAAVRPSIQLQTDSSARLRIANIDLTSSETTQDCIRVNAGTLQINGGRIRRIGNALRALYLTAGSLIVRNVEMVAEGARSVAYVVADAGELTVQNCNWVSNGGTGAAITTTASGVTGRISDNLLNGRTLNIAIGSLYGAVNQRFSGTFSADATTLAYLPAGWSVAKPSTGEYRITHNLGWNVNRTFCTFIGQSSSPTNAISYVVDSTNTTTNMLVVKVYLGGVLTDIGTRFEINHT